MLYGALVPDALVEAGAVLDAGGVDESSWLQPVNIALKAMPNSTAKDSFFIGR
jgi:hypothetical protein